MATATLIADRGAQKVDRDALNVLCPAATATHFPIPHLRVVEACEQTLAEAAYGIRDAEFVLGKGGNQLFATFTLENVLVPGVRLAVGLRTSYDKTFPLGLVAGHRVIVCSNLAFRGDLVSVRRKHTRYGEQRFRTAIAAAVTRLADFRESERKRVAALQAMVLSTEQAESLILRAHLKDIVSYRLLRKVHHEWQEPSHDEFRSRTAWSLFNSVTTALAEQGQRNPHDFARRTMRLHTLLNPFDTVSLVRSAA